MDTVYGGIELGGTKLVCAVGTGPDDLRTSVVIDTTEAPDADLDAALAFFEQQARQSPLAAVGIASFGPIDLRKESATFGSITETPKTGWRNTDLVQRFRRRLGVPVEFDTDVNGAALAEQRWGAAQGLASSVYGTVGTGIGFGAIVHGERLHGLVHPEMGHLPMRHDLAADPFVGVCPYHRDCLEGLASGEAIGARWGQRADTLPVDHPAWKLEAHYLALGLVTIILILSPERIVLGGGVMHQLQLFPLIRAEVSRLLNGYLATPMVAEHCTEYIVPAALGDRAGVLGAIALAELAR